ncbi:MAG: hypothetical protein AB1921_00585 [Thermodesulfobacteriota bacterium]
MSSSSTEKKDVRKFGLVGLLFFLALAGVALWRGKQIPLYVFSGLSVFMLFFLALPGPMTPVYTGWIFVAAKIGRVMNALILSLTFFLVITPFALARRALGKRPLPLKPDPAATTYWVKRKTPAQPRKQFAKRY